MQLLDTLIQKSVAEPNNPYAMPLDYKIHERALAVQKLMILEQTWLDDLQNSWFTLARLKMSSFSSSGGFITALDTCTLYIDRRSSEVDLFLVKFKLCTNTVTT